jgi:N-acetylneuraminate lyase
MKNFRLTGLIAAPFTPMHPDGAVNLSLIDKLAKHLAANQVAGAFVNGTTGEGLSLTTDERMKIVERWRNSAPPGLRLIVHVGHTSVLESRALAAHAARFKADAIAAMAPSFFRINHVDQLVDWCARIAEAAPALPFYYYHFPVMTGADLPMADFLTQAGRRIPNLAGIKFTHENLMDYRRCLAFDHSRYNLLFGRDEMMLAALGMGATGLVGSTYNYIAPLYHRLIAAFNRGDLPAAQDLQSQAIEIITVMSRHGGLSAGKHLMRMIGFDCGSVRAPLQELTSKAAAALERELRRLGFPQAITELKSSSKTK